MKKQIGRVEFLALLKNKVSKKDLLLIEDAYTLAKYGHRNQERDEGVRYFEHPKQVALVIIKELNIFDPEIIMMALLHDVMEDSFILSVGALKRLFGTRVTEGLDFLTKKDDVATYVARLDRCNDMGVLMVKFADRLHNLRTLDGCSEEKCDRKIKETKMSYIPLMTRTLNRVKTVTEREAFTYLQDEINAVLDGLTLEHGTPQTNIDKDIKKC
jgi:(p)ppGpp synthase/HD superfamily hydrolase